MGLSGREMVAVVSLVEGYVRGAAQSAVEARFAAPRTGVTDEHWWAVRDPLLGQYFDARRYPTLVDLDQTGAFDPSAGSLDYSHQNAMDGFAFGLERVLDGIDTFIRARSAPPART